MQLMFNFGNVAFGMWKSVLIKYYKPRAKSPAPANALAFANFRSAALIFHSLKNLVPEAYKLRQILCLTTELSSDLLEA